MWMFTHGPLLLAETQITYEFAADTLVSVTAIFEEPAFTGETHELVAENLLSAIAVFGEPEIYSPFISRWEPVSDPALEIWEPVPTGGDTWTPYASTANSWESRIG